MPLKVPSLEALNQGNASNLSIAVGTEANSADRTGFMSDLTTSAEYLGIYVDGQLVLKINKDFSIFTNTAKVWTELNDGSGSGLDADSVDGVHLSGLVQTSRTISTTAGQLVGGGALSSNLTLGLATTPVTPSNYGTASAVPEISVDSFGRITDVIERPISIGDSAILGVVSVPKGGTGLSSIPTGHIPYGSGTSALQTSSGLTYNGTDLLVNSIDTSGTTLSLGANASTINIAGGPSAQVINIGNAGDTVNIPGTLVTVNTSTLSVTDKIIITNVGGAAATGFSAGLAVEEAGTNTAYILTHPDRSKWSFKVPTGTGVFNLKVGNYSSTLDTSAISGSRNWQLPNASGTVTVYNGTYAVGRTLISQPDGSFIISSSAPVLAGLATSSGLTVNGQRLLGRSSLITGQVQEIVIGTGLALVGNTLVAVGGGGGGGGVSAVGLDLPSSVFSVTVPVVTSTGTLTAVFNTQSANTVFAGPTSGGAAVPTFRSLVGTDLPLFTPILRGAVPASGGGTTNFLRADGTWAAPAGGSGSPGGSNTHVQFNDSGVLGGDADFTWDKTNNILRVNGRLRLPHISAPTPVDGDIWTQTDGVYFQVNGTTLSLPTSLATQTANTFFAGPTSGGAAAPTFRNIVAADLPIFNSGAAGAVPASGGGTTNFLRADGTWASTSGSGSAIGGWEFYYSWQCGADTGWKKIADITVGTEIYAGAAYDIDVIDSDTDQGAFVSAKIMTFIARVTRSTGTLDVPNDAGVSGPVADYIRIEKVSTGVYEIHFRSPNTYKNVSVRARLNHKLGTVSTTWQNLTAITGTGTLYTPALGHTHLFPWITAYRITNLTTNGFVKTSGGDGTITIDTNTYLTANQTITLSGDVTGSGTTAITTTLASVITAGGPTGSASVVPVITYDAKGRLTAVTTATITPAAIGAATSTHVHGNITNAGAIGSTANLPIITTTGGVLTTGSFGTGANTFCQGNDSRLSDSRTPTAHVLDGALHTISGKTAGQVLLATAATTFAFTTIGGDATLNGSGTLTLASTITAGGPIGSDSVVPVITYDAKGRLTAVTTATITTTSIGAQPVDADLTAIAAQTGTGILVRTGTDTWTTRTITVATGLSIANPGGVGGTIQISPANDLAALESISATGFAARTATDSWFARTLTAPAAGFTIANPGGVSGNPVFTLSDDLAGVEGISTTGVVVRTAANTWTTRSMVGTTNQITVTDGDGVAGSPTVSIPSFVVLGSSPSTAPAIPNGAHLHIVAADGAPGGLCADGWGGTNGLVLLGRLSGGTRAAPTATPAGAIIVNIVSTGYEGAYLTPVYARYRQVAKNAWTASDRSTFHQWDGTPTGSTTPATWMTLDGGRLSILSSEASTSTTTGAATITGGVGIGGSLYIGGSTITAASTTTAAGLRIPHGVAPTTPTNGDVWTTSAGLFVYINGTTVGPLGSGGGLSGSGVSNRVAYWSGTSALTSSANWTFDGVSETYSLTSTTTSSIAWRSTSIIHTAVPAASTSYTAFNTLLTISPSASTTNTNVFFQANAIGSNLTTIAGSGPSIRGAQIYSNINIGTIAGGTIAASVAALLVQNSVTSTATSALTLSNLYGVYVVPFSGWTAAASGTTITNYFGLRVDDAPTGISNLTITNRYGIFQSGSTAINSFSGRTLVTNSTAATTTSDGAFVVTGGVSVGGSIITGSGTESVPIIGIGGSTTGVWRLSNDLYLSTSGIRMTQFASGAVIAYRSSLTPPTSGTFLGALAVGAYDGAVWDDTAARIRIVSAEDWTTTARGADLQLRTRRSGTTSSEWHGLSLYGIDGWMDVGQGLVIGGIGRAAQKWTSSEGVQASFQVFSNNPSSSSIAIGRFTADGTAPRLILAKSRSATPGAWAAGAVTNATELGRIVFEGSDGTNPNQGADITAIAVNAGSFVIGTGIVPTRFRFRTEDAAGVLAERLSIWPDGGTVIGSTHTSSPGAGVLLLGTDPGGSELLRVGGAIRAGSTIVTTLTAASGAIAVNTAGVPGFECRSVTSSVTDAAYINFHRPGLYAVRFGLDTDNIVKVGGWSLGNVAYRVILGDSYANGSRLILAVAGSITEPTLELFETGLGLFRSASQTVGFTCNSTLAATISQSTGSGALALFSNDSSTDGSNIVLRRASTGTNGSVIANDRIGFILASGKGNDSTFRNNASIEFDAESVHTATSAATRIEFHTTVSGSVTRAERLRIYGDGGVQIGGTYGTSPGIGSLKLDSGTSTSNTLEVICTGTNGANILITGNGGTTPNKTLRVTSGVFEVINSAYTSTILALTDAGQLTVASTLITPAATTSIASLRVPHGAAPTTPVNGDIWTTTAGLYVRINGATVGPLGSGGGGGLSGSGTAGNMAYWTGASTLADAPSFTYNVSTGYTFDTIDVNFKINTVTFINGSNVVSGTIIPAAGTIDMISDIRSSTAVRAKGAAAGIELAHNSATGNFNVRLVPANITANRTFTFPNVADNTVTLGTGSTSRPAYWNGTNTVTSSANWTYDGSLMVLSLSSTQTATAQPLNTNTVTVATTSTTASSANFTAVLANAVIGTAGTGNTTGTVLGLSASASRSRLTATVSVLRGADISVTSTASSGTTTAADALRLVVSNGTAGHTMTTATALSIPAFTATGTITNRYAIDQQGSSDQVRFAGRTFVLNSTAATTTTDGAFVVTGGAGVGGALYVGGATRLTANTASSSTTTGTLVVTGGTGISGNLYVGNQLDVANQLQAGFATITGSLSADGVSSSGTLEFLGELYMGGSGTLGNTVSSWTAAGSVNARTVTINTNTATIGSYTVNLPAAASGRTVFIQSRGIVSTLTVTATSGTVSDAPAALTAGQAVYYWCDGSVWRRLL